MATWQFAEWDLEDDPAQKLILLKKHIAELSQHTMGTSTRGNSVTPVSDAYVNNLMAQKVALEKRLGNRGYRVNSTTFRRG
jgi:hypothetical protein